MGDQETADPERSGSKSAAFFSSVVVSKLNRHTTSCRGLTKISNNRSNLCTRISSTSTSCNGCNLILFHLAAEPRSARLAAVSGLSRRRVYEIELEHLRLVLKLQSVLSPPCRFSVSIAASVFVSKHSVPQHKIVFVSSLVSSSLLYRCLQATQFNFHLLLYKYAVRPEQRGGDATSPFVCPVLF